MRDINRIYPFLARLGKVWEEQCPDWRFGQMMVNVLGEMPIDPFFPEEDEMIVYIENYFKPSPRKLKGEQNGQREEVLQEK